MDYCTEHWTRRATVNKRDFPGKLWAGISAVDWRVILFSLVLLVVFTSLGMWQLRRAEEKVQLLNDLETRRNQQPIENLAGYDQSIEKVDGLPVILRGSYIQGSLFLLDNIVIGGKVGFDVLVWFKETGTDRFYLVDRGYVAMGRTRADIPEIPALETVGKLKGHIYARDYDPLDYDPRDYVGQALLPPASTAQPEGSPGSMEIRITQVASPGLLSRPGEIESAEYAVYPYLVRLTSDDPNGLPRNWIVANISPEKHTGYAIQWFLMALAVVVLFIRLAQKQKNQSPLESDKRNKL